MASGAGSGNDGRRILDGQLCRAIKEQDEAGLIDACRIVRDENGGAKPDRGDTIRDIRDVPSRRVYGKTDVSQRTQTLGDV